MWGGLRLKERWWEGKLIHGGWKGTQETGRVQERWDKVVEETSGCERFEKEIRLVCGPHTTSAWLV